MSNKNNTLEGFKVAIRVRPFLRHENLNDSVVYIDEYDDRKIKIGKEGNFHEGYYDKIFNLNSKQIEVFHFAKECVRDILSGINSTIFAYGNTGSGKTYTMFGADWTGYGKETTELIINPYSEDIGLTPRLINQFFSEVDTRKKKFTVRCSFLQIYNEKIYDLLDENITEKTKNLNIREDKYSGIYVEGLTDFIAENVYDCLNLLRKGEKQRKTRATKNNNMSSRSHTIFILNLEDTIVDNKGKLKKAKLHLCDLAGSEKHDKDEHHKSAHFGEMVNINQSLVTLGKVIQSLAQKSGHAPYRDSKLTRLLQDSLGGNTRTYFISTISPSPDLYEESLSTLKFADRAKSVMIKVKPNEVMAFDEDLVKKLLNEINQLKQILSMRKKIGTVNIENQLIKLKEENDKLKQFAMNSENIEYLINENNMLKLELQKFKSISTTEVTDLSNTDKKSNAFSAGFSLGVSDKEYLFSYNTTPRNNLPSTKLTTLMGSYSPISQKKSIDSVKRDYSEDVKQIQKANKKLQFLEELQLRNSQKTEEQIKKIQENKQKINEDKMNKLSQVTL